MWKPKNGKFDVFNSVKSIVRAGLCTGIYIILTVWYATLNVVVESNKIRTDQTRSDQTRSQTQILTGLWVRGG